MDIKESQQLAGEYFKSGNMKQAADVYKGILRTQPDDQTALFMLGLIHAQGSTPSAAIEYFQKVIQINPSYAHAHYNLGNVYRDKGFWQKAFNCYQKTIQLNPNYTEAYINLGIIYRLMRRYDEEYACYHKALQVNPSSAEAWFNLGHSFFEKEDFDKALECYEKVVHLHPGHLHAYMTLGLVLRIKGLHEDAIGCYRKALEYNPSDASAHWNLSNVLLLLGDYAEGWKEFEWFRRTPDCSKRQRSFVEPLWDGSDIRGLTILLHAEEGFGDTIQFIRYAHLVAQLGAKIIVASQPALTSLLKNMDCVQQVVSHGEKLPAFDVHFPLMSLPRVFHTTLDNIPFHIPYLTPDDSLRENWQKRLHRDNAGMKIGLVWSGGGLPLKKSTSLDMFAPLATSREITLFSLQKGKPAEQAKNPPAGMKLIDYTNELRDFSDTAALIQNLDLVISVDTAVAHLAGALGKPTWVLLPFVPDWRWLLNREDSPWYPTMRLFRQPALGDWKSVIISVIGSLNQLRIRNEK